MGTKQSKKTANSLSTKPKPTPNPTSNSKPNSKPEVNSKPQDIDSKEKLALLTVGGYIRDISLLNHIIPESIIHLCHTFYYLKDCGWDPHFGPNIGWIDFDDNDPTIIYIECYGAQTAYLKTVFSKQQHHWEFKFLTHPSMFVLIGISQINPDKMTRSDHQNNCFETENVAYSFDAGEAALRKTNHIDRNNRFIEVKYGQRCVQGDIIDMYVDMNKLELSYSINDKYYGKAHDIEPGEYRAAVAITAGSYVQFISYDNKQH